MTGRIETGPLTEILKKYPECRKLVLDGSSAMNDTLEARDSIFLKSTASVYFLDEKIVGWSWVFSTKVVRWNDRVRKYLHYPVISFMLFVKRKYRLRGIGKELYFHSKNLFKHRHRSFVVYPWDRKSGAFYNSLSIKESNKVDW